MGGGVFGSADMAGDMGGGAMAGAAMSGGHMGGIHMGGGGGHVQHLVFGPLFAGGVVGMATIGIGSVMRRKWVVVIWSLISMGV